MTASRFVPLVAVSMERLLARLERRFGSFALPNTAAWVVGTWAVAFAMTLAKPELPIAMIFEPHAVMRGQVWRLASGFFVPPQWSLLFFLFNVSFYYFILSSLEDQWGSFRLDLYLFVGWGLCLAAGFLFRMPVLATPMHMALGVAFGVLFPDVEIRLYLLIPVKAKWLAVLDLGLILWQFVLHDRLEGPLIEPLRVSAAAAGVGFLLFFGGDIVRLVRGQAVVLRQQSDRRRFAPEPQESRPVRTCSICGKSEDEDDADLRVCTCAEVCGGKPTVYCLPHARSHNKH